MAPERELRRRRVLALSAAAVTGLAGCPAGEGTDTAVETDARTRSQTESPTESPTETATPDHTDQPHTFSDDFSAGDLSAYRAVRGSLDPWGIDDERALVDTTGTGNESLIAPATDALAWTGTGQISIDIRFGADQELQNCKLLIGAIDGGPSSYVQVDPSQILVSAPGGDTRQAFPELGVEERYTVEVSLTGGSLSVVVDGEHEVEMAVEEPLPTGTVAFGIEAGRRDTGGKTWFDEIDVSADE